MCHGETEQAETLIHAFANAYEKGLRPDDYDAARWQQRLDRLKTINKSHDTSEGAQETL